MTRLERTMSVPSPPPRAPPTVPSTIAGPWRPRSACPSWRRRRRRWD